MNTAFPVKLLSQLRPLLIGFRKSKGLTQKELSARLGVTQQTYARLESNPSKTSFERLYKVLNILGVEMSLSSVPILTDANPANFVEKEFDSPARREEW
jgi:HTH-type transcriptional regulator/antitoxin HipB